MLKRVPRPLVTALILACTALAACSGSSAPGPAPASTPTSSSPSPAPPEQQLQQLAELGTSAAFQATYSVRQKHPASQATWKVWRAGASLRVDVLTKHVTATLIVTPHATYSCRRPHATCFTVARGNKPIPAQLRLLAEELFSADVTTLAMQPSAFSVTSTSEVPKYGHCFAVTPTSSKAAVDLDKADYCFNDSGLLTRVSYPNGNVVALEHSVIQPPKPSTFVPYSSPTPLPG